MPKQIKIMIRTIEKELSDADWQGDEKLAAQLRARLAILKMKIELGEQYEVEF